MNRATQISIMPFLLRGLTDLETSNDRIKSIFARLRFPRFNCVKRELSAVETGLLGSGFQCFDVTNSSPATSILISEFGVAAILICWPSVDLPANPRSLLELRRNRHTWLLSGDSTVGRNFRRIGLHFRSILRPLVRFPKWFSQNVPLYSYVFSLWVLDGKGGELRNENEYSLLFPSLYHMSDTLWEAPPPNVLLRHGPEQIYDYDNNCNCLPEGKATWASVVLCPATNFDIVSIYTSLELRLQGLWMLSHCIEQTKPRFEGVSVTTVDILAALFERATCALYGINDPMINERVLQIQGQLVTTSNLDRVIQNARQNLNTLRAIGSSKAEVKRTQFERVTQVLLFLIASFQIVPLVTKVPLTGKLWYSLVVVWPLMLIAFVVVALRRRL